jgi:alpha-galactosidase
MLVIGFQDCNSHRWPMIETKLPLLVGQVMVALLVTAVFPQRLKAQTAETLSNRALTASVRSQDGSFELRAAGLSHSVFSARVGAQIDHQWVRSTDYPKHQTASSGFQTGLGPGHQLEVSFTGLADKPDLKYILRLYDDLPFGDIQVQVLNSGRSSITVQAIRVLDVTSRPVVDLGAPNAADRVLSDSYSEDRPVMRIYDLGKARPYKGRDDVGNGFSDVHLAVGSQLLYSQTSKFSLFLGALSSDRWLTIFHLNTAGNSSGEADISSYTVDCTGTTEIVKKESLHRDPASDQIELSLPLPPGGELSSEQLMIAAGQDYFSQLETYGNAVRVLRHALVSAPSPWGWWSWTAYYFALSEGTGLSNAQWLAQHLKSLGFDFFHIDAGYAYADGEYTTANAALFPHGLRDFGHQVCRLGLKFAVWTAPFRVSERAWVFQKHPEWLVHNDAGKPIQIGFIESSHDAIYVLDSTHPGAQEYLRRTYETIAREWGVRYIKLDFMDDTAIEGRYYRPNTTALEAQRIGLKIIHEAVGPKVLLDKDGSPMLNTVGITELGRISADTGHSYEGIRDDATGIAARYYMNGNFFGADPDAFAISQQVITEGDSHEPRKPLTLDEAEASIALAAVAGGMFELGDDLPTLGAEPDRLSLVENKDLLDMMRLAKSAKPLDLMTYSAEDEQPSVFILRESARQNMLVLFNWTEHPRSHEFTFRDLGLAADHNYEISDIFHKDRSPSAGNGSLRIDDQAPHSVRVLKITDPSVAAAAPSISLHAPPQAALGQSVEFSAVADANGVPPIAYHWDFGDGVSADSASTSHAYTHNGSYTVRIVVDGIDGIPAAATASIAVQGAIKTSFDVPNARRYQEDRPEKQ